MRRKTIENKKPEEGNHKGCEKRGEKGENVVKKRGEVNQNKEVKDMKKKT